MTKMNLNLFLLLAVNGITMGMIYSLIAMGLIMLIRAVGVLNFAQGALLLVGTYFTSWLLTDIGLPIYLMLPVAVVMFAVLGVLFMLATYWPLRNASYSVAPIIATMGASWVLTEGAALVFGTWPRTMPHLITDPRGRVGTFLLFGARVQWQYLLTIFVAIVAMILVNMLFEKLYIGRIMQAAAQDKTAAELIGISTLLTTAITYALVVILISIGGYMVAPLYMITPTLPNLQLRAFAGTVIGGFGSIKGAVIGCLIVGLTEAFSTIRFSSYKDAVVFSVLIMFLAIRPDGLFKSRIGDKA